MEGVAAIIGTAADADGFVGAFSEALGPATRS